MLTSFRHDVVFLCSRAYIYKGEGENCCSWTGLIVVFQQTGCRGLEYVVFL